MSDDKTHRCDRYELATLPGVSFCRKGGARAVGEMMQDHAARVAELERLVAHYERETAALRNECDGLTCPKTEAAEAKVAELERELGLPGPTNHDETPLRARLAEVESRALSLAAEASALREALRAVEWIAVASDGTPSCLNCAYALYAGHSKACVVGKAIAAPSSAAAVLSARDNETRRVVLEEAAQAADRHALKWQALAVDELDKANDANVDADHVWRRDAHQHKCMGSVGVDIAADLRALAATSPAPAPPARVRDLDWHLEPEDLAEPPAEPKCATCGHHAKHHAVDGEERAECERLAKGGQPCPCQQFVAGDCGGTGQR